MSAIKKTYSCPSYFPSLKAKIIGVKSTDKVHILPQALSISEEFLKKIENSKIAVTDFRYSGKCMEGKCKQWGNGQCGLVANVLEKMNAIDTEIPNCPIRTTCRWYSQKGADACKVCEQVSYYMEEK